MGNICYKTKPKPCAKFFSTTKTNGVKIHTPKKNIPKSLKRLTYIGDSVGKTLCLCCNHVYIRQIEFHCGHVIAEANGGVLTKENLRPICAQCNLSMGTQNMDEFKKMFV